MTEHIELLLKSLKLPAFVRHYRTLLEEHTDMTPQAYLAQLCEYELAERYARRVHNWTREAGLPPDKTLASLKLNHLAQPARPLVQQLIENRNWWHRAENVLLVGASGVGKTHLAAALGHQLIELEVRCKLFPAIALVQELQRAKHQLELMSYLSRLDKYRVIILDDIGYVRKTDSETQVLFEFIAHRYESGSLVITSNQPFSEWDAIFPDNVMTVAAIDRLIHHATIIKLEGGSYRQRQQSNKTLK